MTKVIVPKPVNPFLCNVRRMKQCETGSDVSAANPCHYPMNISVTFFKAITGALFVMVLLALGLLAYAFAANRAEDTSFLLGNTYVQIILVITVLLLIVFLFIRFNFNDLLAHEQRLEELNESRRVAESKLKQLLEDERDLNRLKSDFIRLASHEFRSPLTVVLSSAFLLEKYAAVNNLNKVQVHSERIRNAVKLLTQIINDCLCVSAIEEGTLDVKTEVIDLKDFTEDICLEFQELVKPGQKILYTHSGPRRISTDPYMLKNIASKLLTNAVKYSPENSLIEVITAVNSDVHLIVRDHGIGIPKSEQAHLFDRFFRASNAAHVQGAGLGLFIIRHYAEMLGGSIEVISDRDLGAEFHVKIKDSTASEPLESGKTAMAV